MKKSLLGFIVAAIIVASVAGIVAISNDSGDKATANLPTPDSTPKPTVDSTVDATPESTPEPTTEPTPIAYDITVKQYPLAYLNTSDNHYVNYVALLSDNTSNSTMDLAKFYLTLNGEKVNATNTTPYVVSPTELLKSDGSHIINFKFDSPPTQDYANTLKLTYDDLNIKWT